MTAVQTIIVPFQGRSAAAEELTWGQREIWTAMVRQRSWMPIFWLRKLPTGTTLDDVAARLRYCVGKHDSLRTRLTFDRDGEPRQVVADHGELTLEVHEAGARDPAEVATEVRIRNCAKEYDFAVDWPVRPAVVLRDGAPAYLVMVLCHLVMDAMARDMLVRDLSPRDAAGAEATGPQPGGGLQPVELTQWERGDQARQASRLSLLHWERVLRDIPARRFGASAGPRSPRYWEARFESRALALALRLIAPQAAGATAPLLGLFAIALARLTGRSPVVFQVVVSNRFRTQLADVFGPVNQTGLWAVDVADTTMDEALSRSRRRSMGTYKNAYYDPRSRDELVVRICAERGEEMELGCFFNDRRMIAPTPDPAAARITGEQLREALAHTSFDWVTRSEQPSEPLFVHVDDSDDGAAETILMRIHVDTRCLSPDDLEAVLRELDLVALTAAFDRAAPTGVTAATPAAAPAPA